MKLTGYEIFNRGIINNRHILIKGIGREAVPYLDLPDFLHTLEAKGLLKRIETEVDPILEITEITDRVVKRGGPALYFSRVKGSSYPLTINMFGTMERMALALGVTTPDEVARRIQEYLDLLHAAGGKYPDMLKALPRVVRVAGAVRFQPKMVKTAPCQEVVETDPDLRVLPALHCWPQDGGRYITLPLVFSKDPVTGRRNCGMYRMQIFDGKTTGMHWHLHKDGARHFRGYQADGGKRMEVAAALGGDPATIYAATAPLPNDIDEMMFGVFADAAGRNG